MAPLFGLRQSAWRTSTFDLPVWLVRVFSCVSACQKMASWTDSLKAAGLAEDIAGQVVALGYDSADPGAGDLEFPVGEQAAAGRRSRVEVLPITAKFRKLWKECQALQAVGSPAAPSQPVQQRRPASPGPARGKRRGPTQPCGHARSVGGEHSWRPAGKQAVCAGP